MRGVHDWVGAFAAREGRSGEEEGWGQSGARKGGGRGGARVSVAREGGIGRGRDRGKIFGCAT